MYYFTFAVDEPGRCLKRCPPLQAPENGGLIPSSCVISSLFELALCTYVCDLGYAVYGDNKRICLSDGSWSSTAPTCKGSVIFISELFMQITMFETNDCMV